MNLSDDDIDRIVEALDRRITQRFYSDLGKGVWGLVWKAIVIAVVAVAAYGSIKGIK